MYNIDSFTIEVLLGSTWTDISADVLASPGVEWEYGIPGNKSTDLIATPGALKFALKNHTGKYSLNGPDKLTGWAENIPVRLTVSYDYSSVKQFYGRIRSVDEYYGIHANESKAIVTVMDWLDQAGRTPIVIPSIQRSKRADEAITAIIALSPVAPQNTDLETGATAFSTIFDSVKQHTYAYGEMAKVAQSEFAPLYIRHAGTKWETLVIESASQRGSSVAVKTIPEHSDVTGYELREDGGYELREDGGKQIRETLPVTLSKISSGWRAIDVKSGELITNEIIIRAYPRQVDVDLQVLASTGAALPIGGNSTITTKLNYVDPTGGGRKVNALTDTMQTPQAGAVQDTTLKALLHFDTDATDSTGYRTWTLVEGSGPMIEDDVYSDGYGILRIANNIIGPWCLFGGYANYRLTAPDSADFDFGTGDFTIGWWEARVDKASGDATLARDTNTYPGYLLGKSDGRKLYIYMSSNGSSWDIANGKSLGYINASKWTHYEIGRKSGWFYAFADGKLTDTWYSSAALLDSSGVFVVGMTQGTTYTYMGLDELYIYKGKCLHTKDFLPPTAAKSIYVDEDYWGNTTQSRTGTNLTANITITPTYGTEAVQLVIANSSASAGYVYAQVRGLGVYFNSPDEAVVQDSTSIAAKGYLSVTLDQKYQQSSVTGKSKATGIVTNRATPRADLLSMTFTSGRSHALTAAALYCDVGDLVQIEHAVAGIDGYYYIQSVKKRLTAGNILECTWTFVQDFEH